MTVTVMKMTYEKLKSRIVNYSDYENFAMIHFKKRSTKNINKNCSCFEKFLRICIDTCNILATCKKKKYSQGNNMSFMNIFIKKAYMKRSRLNNTYVKEN